MDDNEIYKIIGNIIENVKIIQTMYQDCIDVSKTQFKETERKLIGRFVQEINKKLQEIILTKDINFFDDIRGHYYDVCDICRFDEWPEFKEYLKYIDDPFYRGDGGRNVYRFLRSSFERYKFPTEYIFDYYDNGHLRFKLAEFMSKNSGKVFGNSYEDYL